MTAKDSLLEKLCCPTDVPDDEPLLVELTDGHKVAVYRWEGAYYCTDDLCSHGEASLAEGYVEDGEIVCPFHLGSFCIKTGAARAAPCSEPIRAYRVTAKDDALYIER